MAENPDAMELQRRARRRLVGAIALVVFVVIVLPIVFDREPKPISQDLTIQIPSQDAGRFPSRAPTVAEARSASAELKESAKAAYDSRPDAGTAKAASAAAEKSDRVEDVARPPAAPRAETAAKQPAPKADAGKPDVAKVEVAKADVSKAEPVKAEAGKAAAPKATVDAPKPSASVTPQSVEGNGGAAKAKVEAAKGPSGESFVIPLGLFRNPDNIKKVRGWVTNAGYASFTEQAPETASAGKAAAVKVLAGPFPSRDAAEKARDKLKAKGVDVGPIAPR